MTITITVLSTADFNAAVWTNKQYLATGLSNEFDVTYIESMGLRRPELSLVDIKRSAKRLAYLRKPAEETVGRGRCSQCTGESGLGEVEAVRVVSPLVIPLHGQSFVRAINRLLVRRQLLPKLMQGQGSVLWTFSPMTYGLEQYHDRTVYHSVDLLHELPGVPKNALLSAERQLIRQADRVLASSEGVADHLRSIGSSDVEVWENVADVDRFTPPSNAEHGKAAIFAGNLTPTKVDFSLLNAVADSGITLYLAGPINVDGVDANQQVDALSARGNVHYLGNLTLDELSHFFSKCRVGLIPYVDNGYTSGVFPLKVYEYLAAGLSVVSTDIKSVVLARPEGVQVSPPMEYPQTVLQEIESFDFDAASKRAEIAKSHGWPERIERASNLIRGW